jgi:hypothetical protein
VSCAPLRPLREENGKLKRLVCGCGEPAASRVRFGYRRLAVILRREGWRVNPKRIYPQAIKTDLRALSNKAGASARTLESVQQELIRRTLEAAGGNCSGAA